VRTQTRLHSDNTPWQCLEGGGQSQPLDPPPQHQSALRIKSHQMKHILADVDANNRQIGQVFRFTFAHYRFSFCFG
jgi:hypothetical protein